MREKGLAPSRRPFENGTIRHMLSSKIYEHAFIYYFLSRPKMGSPILTHVFRDYLMDGHLL